MSKTKRTILVFWAILQIADLLSTALARFYGLAELNPLLGHHGAVNWPLAILAKFFAVGAMWYLLRSRERRLGLYWALCGFYTLVVVNNVVQSGITGRVL